MHKIPSIHELYEKGGGDKVVKTVEATMRVERRHHHIKMIASLCFMGLYRNVAIVLKDKEDFDILWPEMKEALTELQVMSNLRTSFALSRNTWLVDGVSLTGHKYAIRFILASEAAMKFKGLQTDIVWLRDVSEELSQETIGYIRIGNRIGYEPLVLEWRDK